MEDPKETDRKLQYLRKAFGKMPNVDAICKSARTGVHQSILALGDRRVADALEHRGRRTAWTSSARCKDAGLDPAFYLFRGRGRDEILPWDIVDNGVAKSYYLRELDKAAPRSSRPHCPEIQGCIRCGVCVETPNPLYACRRSGRRSDDAAALREAGGADGLSRFARETGRGR